MDPHPCCPSLANVRRMVAQQHGLLNLGGAVMKDGTRALLVGLSIVSAAVLLIHLNGPGTGEAAPDRKPSPPILWHVKLHTKTAAFGCRDADELRRIVRYSAQGDEVASMKLFFIDMANGEYRSLKPGTTVYVSDTDVFAGLVRIRRKGELSRWWTFSQVIAIGRGQP